MVLQAEEELVDRAISGDRKAVEALLRHYYPTVHGFAQKICRDRNLAEDIAQDAVVKIMGSIRGFDQRCSFRSWVYRVVLTKAQDHFRKTKRRGLLDDGIGNPEDNVVEARQEEDATARKLWDLVLQLPDEERKVAILVLGEDLSHREAAEIIGCPTGTIGWRLGRAIDRLKTMLESDDNGRTDIQGTARRSEVGTAAASG